MTLHKMTMAIGVMLTLSGCASVMGMLHPQGEASQTQEATNNELTGDDGTLAQDSTKMPSLMLSWPLGQHTMISAPVDIQTQAIDACQARGHDISYMIEIAIVGDTATAEFGCRGSD